MDTRTLLRSFAAGQITPELFGRLDLAKNQTGLALCKNWRVLPHGPVVNREGSEWINEVKTSSKRTRLVPFTISDTVNYILEVGDQYLRFHTNGGTVVEAAKTITGWAAGVVTSVGHGFSNGQWVFIDNVGGISGVNGRFLIVAGAAANTFTLMDMAGAPVPGSGVYTSGGTASRVYEIASPFLEADVFGLHYASATTKMTFTNQTYAVRELTITAPTSWAITTASFNTPATAPASCGGAATANVGVGATSLSYFYQVTSVDQNGNESIASPSSAATPNNLYTAGNYNTVTWPSVGGQLKYRIYKSLVGSAVGTGGAIYGFIGEALENATPSFIDNNITIDYTRTPPANQTIFATATNFPAAVTYFEQRRAFAGSITDSQKVWATRSGTDSNFSKSQPTRDDDPIEFKVAAREVNNIKHMVPLDDLLLFTGSVVWRVFSDNTDALTPSNVTVRPVAYAGASDVQPVTTAAAVLYEENRSGHIIELKYTIERGTYAASDLSLIASNLVNGFTLKDMTFAAGRMKTLWAPRSDGTLLGVTYVPDQDVVGFHQHTTDGTFESAAAVQEGGEDAVYVLVNRTINGRQVRYIERIKTRAVTTLTDSFYVDAGKTSTVVGATTISNLYHLEGKTVNVLVDGAVQAQRVVTNGSITLNQAIVTKATVGLPITADLQTLPPIVEAAAAFGIGQAKNVSRVELRVYQSSGIYAGSSFDKLRQYRQRTTEPYGSPPNLYSGVAAITIDGKWTQDVPVCVRQTDPLPVMIVAMALEVSLAD